MRTYNFAILADKNIKFANPMTLAQLGKKIVKMKMREDGDKTVLEYLEGWAECLEDMSDEGEKFHPLHISDTISYHLTHCNIHIINLDTRCQISSKERDEVTESILYTLDNAKSVKAAMAAA